MWTHFPLLGVYTAGDSESASDGGSEGVDAGVAAGVAVGAVLAVTVLIVSISALNALILYRSVDGFPVGTQQ